MDFIYLKEVDSEREPKPGGKKEKKASKKKDWRKVYIVFRNLEMRMTDEEVFLQNLRPNMIIHITWKLPTRGQIELPDESSMLKC